MNTDMVQTGGWQLMSFFLGITTWIQFFTDYYDSVDISFVTGDLE